MQKKIKNTTHKNTEHQNVINRDIWSEKRETYRDTDIQRHTDIRDIPRGGATERKRVHLKSPEGPVAGRVRRDDS